MTATRAAARELLVSQPSASHRLAALKRRCGVRLFDRDATCARATAAGNEMVIQAQHVLGHLERVFKRSRRAARSDSSLAMLVFPALNLAMRTSAPTQGSRVTAGRLVLLRSGAAPSATALGHSPP